jgi:alkylation response protein AidB-like acyl-CoA dehydrogenase
MSLPQSAGGDGAGIVELSLVAEEFGRALAPVPLLEHVVATRLIAAANGDAELLQTAIGGNPPLGLALIPLSESTLVSTAAIADTVICLDGDEVVALTVEGTRPHQANQACLPYAYVDPSTERRVVLATNATELHSRAVREWKILAAAALVGLTAGALAPAVEFAQSRQTMGVPIGTLQGVSFPLADVHIGVAGARNLYRRAAWFLDHEPEAEVGLPSAALAYAAEIATHGTTVAQHTQGGLGFTVEADVSLYFLRAKGWALAAGDPRRDASLLGELLVSAATTS